MKFKVRYEFVVDVPDLDIRTFAEAAAKNINFQEVQRTYGKQPIPVYINRVLALDAILVEK